VCLRHIPDVEAALRRHGDTPAVRRANAEYAAKDPELAARVTFFDRYAQKYAKQGLRFTGGRRPPPGAPLLDWYAWSLAARGRV
jgi:hypothetical protein